ncbi:MULTISPECIES: flagellar biosynthesis anti-sigma factor FlgM [Enterobacter]|uniref:flagellar biosynthesis anti-sigma factor FlgM n=1 Tax=Enterobacter TaxID=547 RepID=UPI001260C42A|nr:flagellar biosynthesis anti-sigma factor FlgM [Enterobacter oligotrophicus]ELW1648215.1 flagellar biosynthesis anti-sigma factor FlgM [Enterobacter oligotrophicus]MBT9427236.1 flagellar biosynthesis anti-sigma factor FlgM [Enterobacter oligotrophicus]
MKVTSTQYAMTSAVNQASSTAPTRTTSADEMKTSRAAAIDPVLGDAQSQLAALPEVDMARVASMKDAIANGKISVDIDSLTSAIEKYYQR